MRHGATRRTSGAALAVKLVGHETRRRQNIAEIMLRTERPAGIA